MVLDIDLFHRVSTGAACTCRETKCRGTTRAWAGRPPFWKILGNNMMRLMIEIGNNTSGH